LQTRLFASAVEADDAVFSPVPRSWGTNVGGDLAGGTLAAIVSIPLSIGYGLLAFAPLGPAYVPIGIVAGLFGAAFLNLVAIVAGARGAAVYAPRSLNAFMIGSIALHSFAGSDSQVIRAGPEYVAAAMFATMALGGLFQLAFGAARLGRLVRFIPTPVMAGFQNAAALLILYSQVPIVLGIARPQSWQQLEQSLAGIKPLNLLVFFVSLAVIWKGAKLVKKVPAALIGLLAGTLLYYGLVAAGFGPLLGPVLGAIPMGLPDGSSVAAIVALVAHPKFGELLPTMIASALSLAVVASLDVLICAKIVEGLNRQRVPGNVKLLRAGASNCIVPLMGGLSGGINIAGSTANFAAGGRTSLSLLVQSCVVILILVLLAPAVARLPVVVIAAVLTMTAIHLVDNWTVALLKKVAAHDTIDWRAIALDLVVIGTVATIAIAGSIVIAVLGGIGLAVLLFVLRMSRSVIRAEQYGDTLHSRRTRDAEEWAILARHGGRILVLQLEGPLFFGSAENLLHRVDIAMRQGVQYVVLDMRRINDMDSTGARVLIQAHEHLRERGGELLMGAGDAPRQVLAVMRDIGVLTALTRERLFPDADHALEWAENRVAAAAREGEKRPGEYPFAQLDLLSGFSAAEREEFRSLLVRREYAPKQAVFREGEEGHELYIILKGTASVRLRITGDSDDPDRRDQRIVTFAAGTVFGEMALLDSETRSATVIADEPLLCYVLDRPGYERIARDMHPVLVKLLTNLGRELSARLRRANRMLNQLER
jgi:anti-anti-sigma factor